MEALKEAIDGIEKRIEEIDDEADYLRYSLSHLLELRDDVLSGKTQLQ